MEAAFLAVGNISIDLIHSAGGFARRVAGSSFYASLAAARLGVKSAVLAKAGADIVPSRDLAPLLRAGVVLDGLVVGGSTASYELFYRGEDRTLRLRRVGEPISPDDVRSLNIDCQAALASPIYNEIPDETLQELRRRCRLLAVDPQGYIRKRIRGGWIRFSRWDAVKKLRGLADIIVTSKPELPYLARGRDDRSKLLNLLNSGAEIAFMTREGGAKSALLAYDGRVVEIPVVPPKRMVDPGGAGDVSAAAFVTEYLRTNEPVWSALFASSVASFIYEAFGAEAAPSREDAIERLRSFLMRFHAELYREFMAYL